METEDVVIVGEVVHPIRHCLIARDLARARRDRGRGLPSPGQRPVRALHPHPAARRAGAGRRLDRRGGARWSPTTTAPWAALGNRAGRRALRLPGAARRGRGRRRQRDAVRVAGAAGVGSRRPARGRASVPRSGRGRRRSCSGASAPRRPAGWSACLSEFAERGVNLTRIESRPRKQGLGRYMFFVDLEGREDDPAVAAGLDGLRGHVEPLRVLGLVSRRPEPGGWPPAASVNCAPARVLSMACLRNTRAIGVRAASRAPAARASGWPGARIERDVRADQRLHGPARRRAAAQGEGRDDRARRVGAALRQLHDGPAGGDPAGQLRADPPRHPPAQDHPPRGVRPRRLDLPVLRQRART